MDQHTTLERRQLPDMAPHPKAGDSSSGPRHQHGSDVTGDKSLVPKSRTSKAKTKVQSHSQPHSGPQLFLHHHRHRERGGVLNPVPRTEPKVRLGCANA